MCFLRLGREPLTASWRSEGASRWPSSSASLFFLPVITVAPIMAGLLTVVADHVWELVLWSASPPLSFATAAAAASTALSSRCLEGRFLKGL